MPPKRVVATGGNNQLWIRWLEDEKRGLSYRYKQNIDKAQRALRDYPLSLTNPDDLIQVKFFGEAIIKKIKKRAKVENERGEDTTDTAAASTSGPPPRKRPVSNNHRTARLSINETDELINGPNPVLAGLYEPTYLAPELNDYNHPARFQLQPQEPPVRTDNLTFTYCDQAQKPVSQQTAAAVQVHEQQGILLYAILFRVDHLPLARSNGVQQIEPARSEQFSDIPQTYHGLLPETHLLASRIQSSTLPPLKGRHRTTDPLRTLPSHASQLTNGNGTGNGAGAGGRPPNPAPAQPLAIQRSASVASIAANAARAALQRALPFPGEVPAVIPNEMPINDYDDDEDEPMPDVFQIDAPTAERFQAQPPAISTDFTLLKWAPHTYDVVCLIDTREIKDAKSRDYIAEELALRGVRVERRSLQLGDALWIARRKRAYREQDMRNGIMDTGEVVLDFIMERKRIDDLVSSLKDGRFHEQKFRLKKSGVASVFFIIEAVKGKKKDIKPFEDAIRTCISSTQVVNEYFVHQTADTQATVELLKILHDSICNKYRNEEIHVIPPKQVHRETYNALQQELMKRRPNTCILTLYESFNLVNAKSTFQTARECFARQLLCISGMSPERVSFVVEEYGTLRGLWEAFRLAEDQEEMLLRREAEKVRADGKKGKGKSQVPKAELMLAELGKGRRRVGNELSKKVYRLFTDDIYEDGED